MHALRAYYKNGTLGKPIRFFKQFPKLRPELHRSFPKRSRNHSKPELGLPELYQNYQKLPVVLSREDPGNEVFIFVTVTPRISKELMSSDIS